MKRKKLLIGLLLVGLVLGQLVLAQVDPGTIHLKHQWTFDDGTAVDHVGKVTGTINGTAR